MALRGAAGLSKQMYFVAFHLASLHQLIPLHPESHKQFGVRFQAAGRENEFMGRVPLP